MKKLKFILVMLIVANFTFDSKAQDPGVIKPPTYPDGIYTKENSNSRRAIPYPYLREADVMWSKRVWRVIDLKEKINHPLYYPAAPLADRKSLFDVLKDAAIKEGRVKCFSPTDDEFRIEFTKSEVEGLLVNWDSTNQTEDPNNPGTMMTSPLKKEITSEEITKYWIKEDWFFDKQRSVLDVRIIGLQVVIAKKTEGGEDAGGDKPLFWVYFPEIRPLLANQEVYMRHNDSERRTLEDIFWKRMFSSYVIKETNVYDRYISEYTSGINALFEAERVKEDIFKFEHDLWHF
ncbi:MAG: gliding motility protein GldN [Bacteroidetes bacterium]|nr:gliding motility protein GldN [Bacteroidota bacterium]